MSMHRLRELFAGLSWVLLSACGGGDGDTASAPTLRSPPSNAATLTQSPAEASEAVKAANAGAAAIAGQHWGPASSFLPFADVSASQDAAHEGGREQALSATALDCSDLFAPPCSGSLMLDTNVDAYAETIPAGSYMAYGFSALQGSFGGESLTLDGTLRVDFLTASDQTATSPANGRFLVTSSNLSGSSDGKPFGPQNSIKLVEFDSQGDARVTADGMTFSGLAGVSLTDADSYRIGAGRLRFASWSDSNAYVDGEYRSWNVSSGRATTGSAATLSAGAGSIAITVSAATADSITYDVDIITGGVAKRYTITAHYPAGGGAPSYVALEVAE